MCLPPGLLTTGGLIGALQALYGAAATTLLAAGLGRLIYHGNEVRAGRRSLIGWYLVLEVPTAVGMAMVAEALAAYFGLSPQGHYRGGSGAVLPRPARVQGGAGAAQS